MRYQYLLFDLDGTITDPKVGITTCVQYALEHFGIHEQDNDKLEPFIGPPLQDSFEQFYHMDAETAKKAVAKYRERFQTVGLYENEIYDGMLNLLKTLKEGGCRLAVASSKPTVFVKKILEHFDVAQYFDVVVGSELDGSRTKKEEVVQEALRQLDPKGQASSGQMVMIGDRCFDVQGAKAHHLDSIGVAYGYAAEGELQQAGATFVVDTVQQLKELLTR